MCVFVDSYAYDPPKLLPWRQPANELQRNLILNPSAFNFQDAHRLKPYSIYLASTPNCAVIQIYYLYRMYSKSDINISVKKTANVQKALCSINLQKRESVSVGQILTVTKKHLDEFCIQLETLRQQHLVWLYLYLDFKNRRCFLFIKYCLHVYQKQIVQNTVSVLSYFNSHISHPSKCTCCNHSFIINMQVLFLALFRLVFTLCHVMSP